LTPKLLVDENLAAHVVGVLQDMYPGSAHVSHVDLAGAPDTKLWAYAAAEGFVLVTKDEDFIA